MPTYGNVPGVVELMAETSNDPKRELQIVISYQYDDLELENTITHRVYEMEGVEAAQIIKGYDRKHPNRRLLVVTLGEASTPLRNRREFFTTRSEDIIKLACKVAEDLIKRRVRAGLPVHPKGQALAAVSASDAPAPAQTTGDMPKPTNLFQAPSFVR